MRGEAAEWRKERAADYRMQQRSPRGNGPIAALCALVLCALAFLAACDSRSPVAPVGSLITLSANPDRIEAFGKSEITVLVRKSTGFPANAGTIVFLNVNRGRIVAQATTDIDGIASATYFGDGQVGTATIRANTGAAVEASADIEVGLAANSVTLQVTPTSVPETGGIIELLALVRDDVGSPLPGANANFRTEVGTLSSGGEFQTTDEDGSVRDTLTLTMDELTILTSDQFEVTVEVSDETGGLLTESFTVLIRRLPVANFSALVSFLTVTFNDSSTGGPTEWEWTFGDGSSSTEQNPVHAYAEAGTYVITLTVRNSLGESTRSRSVTVTEPPDDGGGGDEGEV